jgi:hypothetical protein
MSYGKYLENISATRKPLLNDLYRDYLLGLIPSNIFNRVGKVQGLNPLEDLTRET